MSHFGSALQSEDSLVRGQAEKVGIVQAGEEKAPGRPYSSLSVLKGGLQERQAQIF